MYKLKFCGRDWEANFEGDKLVRVNYLELIKRLNVKELKYLKNFKKEKENGRKN
jgi:hypothetical protein